MSFLNHSEAKVIMEDPAVIAFVDEFYDLFPGQVHGFGVSGTTEMPILTLSVRLDFKDFALEFLPKEIITSQNQIVALVVEKRPPAVAL